MPIDSGINYADMLSLDKAKLRGRIRLNFLGSQELSLDYTGVANSSKEEAIEWLEANRLELTDPKFGFRTYEGIWKCVSITYVDERSVIRQQFKIDSQVGDLGDADEQPDYSLQAGDLSRISNGVEVERAYYWRVTDPTAIDLPSSEREGEIWTKTANDNGDGTYDVIVSKEVAKNLDATSVSQAGSDSNGGYTETTIVNTNDSEQSFVSDGGTVADPVDGEIKRIENTPLENGKFRTTILTRTYNNQDANSAVQAGGGEFDNYPGAYTEESEVSINNSEQAFVSDGGSVSDAVTGQIKRIDNVPLENGKFRTTVTTRIAVPQRMPPESAAGTGDYPWLEYGSDYIQDANNIIVGRNRTWSEFITDRDRTNVSPAIFKINSISCRVNDYGLFDYTITSNTPG